VLVDARTGQTLRVPVAPLLVSSQYDPDTTYRESRIRGDNESLDRFNRDRQELNTERLGLMTMRPKAKDEEFFKADVDATLNKLRTRYESKKKTGSKIRTEMRKRLSDIRDLDQEETTKEHTGRLTNNSPKASQVLDSKPIL